MEVITTQNAAPGTITGTPDAPMGVEIVVRCDGKTVFASGPGLRKYPIIAGEVVILNWARKHLLAAAAIIEADVARPMTIMLQFPERTMAPKDPGRE